MTRTAAPAAVKDPSGPKERGALASSTTTARAALLPIAAAIAVVLTLSPGCARPQRQPRAAGEASGDLQVRELRSPAPEGSLLPRLTPGPRGGLVLSWVEEWGDGSGDASARWRFSAWDGVAFSPPRTIAAGPDWFINWVDLPALIWLGGERWLGHYLERSASGTYDYQVQLVRTADGGEAWSSPERLHDDDGPGEHGFVAWADLGGGRAFAAWLDGRGLQPDAGVEGATALLARTIGIDGTLGRETWLDGRVCDCCPTAAVAVGDGSVLVAYRDRSSDEVRDIAIVRWREDREPEPVWSSGDGWRIAGCPVNGPALAMDGARVGVAWFTLGSEGEARVLAALSLDGGRSFGPPQLVAHGPVQGRIDSVFDSTGRMAVTWLQAVGDAGEWRVARLDERRGLMAAEVIATTRASRDAGVARLARSGDSLIFAHTEGVEPPRVVVHSIRWD